MKGGIEVKNCVNYSDVKDIEYLAVPKKLYVPIKYNPSSKVSILCKEGNVIKKGTLLCKAENDFSTNIFSPVSGVVSGIQELRLENDVVVPHIIISNDFKYEEEFLPIISAPTQFSVLKRISEAGLIEGDDSFPVHISFVSQSSKFMTLMIDMMNLEPPFCTDYAILKKYPMPVMQGIKLMAMVAEVDNVIFCIPEGDADLKSKLLEEVKYLDNLKVIIKEKKYKYPLNLDRFLCKEIFGVNILSGKRPENYNILIKDIQTAYNVYLAVRKGIPFTEKVVSISKNLKDNQVIPYIIKSGTKLDFLYEKLYGKLDERVNKILIGGMFSGKSQKDVSTTVNLETKSVTFIETFTEQKFCESECIGCNTCEKFCPMNLMPMIIEQNVLDSKLSKASKYGLKRCIGCGLCSYVCPAKRNISQRIVSAQKLLTKEEE